MKQSQLKRALAETETRLAKAQTELQRAQVKVQLLTQKIPELQQAIHSLRVLVGEKPKQPKLRKAAVEIIEAQPLPPTGKMTPEQALKFAAPRDLSGMGSIPYPKDAEPPDENVELPDAEGEEILD